MYQLQYPVLLDREKGERWGEGMIGVERRRTRRGKERGPRDETRK